MEKILSEYGFKFIYLDSLWDKYDISFKKIDNIFRNKKQGWWEEIEMHKTIEKNAEKRSQKSDKKEAAKKYYIMRDLEKEMFEKEFPNAIFHAFSDSKLREVLPNMPTLYFYARKGWSDTPWFVTEDK